jgi:hypothetical protein
VISDTPHISAVRKELDAIRALGHRDWQIYVDWVALMFWAFQRNDDEYLAVMNRYSRDNERRPQGHRPADHFAQAMGGLLCHMKATNEESLGCLYEEYAANHYTGQFFTPASVVEMMAKMTCGGSPAPGLISDPCCGAGIMFVHAAKQMKCADVDKSLFVGVDVDFTCVQMSTLNVMFFNLPALIIHGNSLSLEAWGGWVTSRSYAWGGAIVERLDAQEAGAWLRAPFEVRKEVVKAPEPSVKAKARQLGLFDKEAA